jgi:NADP-dependent 3-hydroxy acid dehydrogenase YdfG
MKTTALITGATLVIEEATKEIFAKNNIKLVLCGRRTERLEKLQTALLKLTEITTFNSIFLKGKK